MLGSIGIVISHEQITEVVGQGISFAVQHLLGIRFGFIPLCCSCIDLCIQIQTSQQQPCSSLGGTGIALVAWSRKVCFNSLQLIDNEVEQRSTSHLLRTLHSIIRICIVKIIFCHSFRNHATSTGIIIVRPEQVKLTGNHQGDVAIQIKCMEIEQSSQKTYLSPLLHQRRGCILQIQIGFENALMQTCKHSFRPYVAIIPTMDAQFWQARVIPPAVCFISR